MPKPQPGCANSSSADTSQMELWTSDPSRTLCPANSQASPSATSSQASVDGALPCNSPDGQRTVLCGPDPVRASLSARQAKEAGLLTSGTCGLHSTTSSASASLQSYLESRLRVLLEETGSTLYEMTWKERATPLGLRICALRASAHDTFDNESGGWPTPSANEDAAGSLNGNMQWMLTHEAKNRDPVGYAAGKQLNPALARWLMGFPVVWDSCGLTAMQSFPKSQPRSSKQQV